MIKNNIIIFFMFLWLLLTCSDQSSQYKNHFWLGHDFSYKVGYFTGFQKGLFFSYHLAQYYKNDYSKGFNRDTSDLLATLLIDVYSNALYKLYYVDKPKDILMLIEHLDQFYSIDLNKNTPFPEAYNLIISKYFTNRSYKNIIDSLKYQYDKNILDKYLK